MNATDFECPTCGAKPGERCHTLTGKITPVSHSKRKRAALDQQYPPEDISHAGVRVPEEAEEFADDKKP